MEDRRFDFIGMEPAEYENLRKENSWGLTLEELGLHRNNLAGH